MNNSSRTRDMARGIYFWACLQDLPMAQAEDPNQIERKAWNDWARAHNQNEIAFVQREQFNLFDRVNATDLRDPRDFGGYSRSK